MRKTTSPSDKLLYSGDSLDIFLSIKSKLDTNGIAYEEGSKPKENFLSFLYRLILTGVGSLGLSSEHAAAYTIYVSAADYETAKRLLL